MAIPERQNSDLSFPEKANQDWKDRNILDEIDATHTEEIVFALCGPIGTPIHSVAEVLNRLLDEEYNYKPTIIRLSNFIEKKKKIKSNLSPFDRYQSLINAGNELRNETCNSILAELGIADISIERNRALKEGEKFQPQRVSHIFDSIKNQAELDILRMVYGRLLVTIGVFSSIGDRLKCLHEIGIKDSKIHELIDRDSGEEFSHGQNVQKIFPQVDFFVNGGLGDRPEFEKKLKRVLDLVTKRRIITPTVEETGMYTAYSAALNSACLSRQVGAALMDKTGSLLSVGWNDVPKFDGGVYMENDPDPLDKRCFNKGDGICFNDREKESIANEILGKLVDNNIILEEKKDKAKSILKRDNRIRDLIEFSRSVHAEMLAIINAGRLGSGKMIAGGKLFVTTFPCHVCARHIVSAGIQEVHFIEPYRKSLALNLHDDAITEEKGMKDKVQFLAFEGVGPGRYRDFFIIGSTPRKNNGKMIVNPPRITKFRSETSLESFPTLEAFVTDRLREQKFL